VFFKGVALEENIWRSLFWKHVMLLIVGILMFVFMTKQRQNFLARFKAGSSGIITINIINELLYMSGNIVAAYAYMLAPVALALLAETYQAFFVLTLGVILTFFLPKMFNESVKKGTVAKKLFALAITGTGTYILLAN
jgi:hypothetical protein